jgi:hypothetical protein
MNVQLDMACYRDGHFRAVHQGDQRCFDWSHELEYEQAADIVGGDLITAFAIAEQELCRGHRQTVAAMDNAVRCIEAKLDCDGRYLRTIEALAAVLSKRFYLDHDEAVALMRAAWLLNDRDFAGGYTMVNVRARIMRTTTSSSSKAGSVLI